MKVNYLDCCSDPDLDCVKVILDTNRESEGLVRCKTCGAYRYHRFLEIMKFNGPDDQTVLRSANFGNMGQRIMDEIGNKPGFKEDKFDGPGDEGGKIIFKFLK